MPVSYDVYVWHRAVGDVEDVLDALAEDDPTSVVAHPSVSAFREALLASHPRLVDVVEPSPTSGDVSAYVALTLPFSWVGDLPDIEQLAVRHGLTGWDPQADCTFGRPVTASAARSAPAGLPGGSDGPWTVERLSGGGLSKRWVTKAWSLAGLPDEITFGQAVGAQILAMALRDGADVDSALARESVQLVAGHCAAGPPTDDVYVEIDYCLTEVRGFARSLASGWD